MINDLVANCKYKDGWATGDDKIAIYSRAESVDAMVVT